MSGNGWLILYLFVVNIVAFALFGIDKYKAVKHKWRIPEQTLFMIAVIGGSFGSRLAMEIFRHKTKKRSFVIGMPLILLFQCIVIFAFYYIKNKS